MSNELQKASNRSEGPLVQVKFKSYTCTITVDVGVALSKEIHMYTQLSESGVQ